GNRRHTRVLQQHAKAVAQVLGECIHDRPLSVFICVYSYLSEINGLIFVALIAGTRHATNATSASNKASIRKMVGSVALTPKSSVDSTRVAANATNSPTTIPIRASLKPLRRINFSTSLVLAPKAMRTPISCVRWTTEKAMMP